jgi:hypothetical protein
MREIERLVGNELANFEIEARNDKQKDFKYHRKHYNNLLKEYTARVIKLFDKGKK